MIKCATFEKNNPQRLRSRFEVLSIVVVAFGPRRSVLLFSLRSALGPGIGACLNGAAIVQLAFVVVVPALPYTHRDWRPGC